MALGEPAGAPKEFGLSEASEHLQDAVYVKDLNGRYLMVNAAAAAAVGLDRDELVGKTDREVFPDDWELVQAADQKVLASGTSHTIEEAVVIEGELRTFLSAKAPLRDDDGNVIGLIGISTDITARKAAEEELKQREAKLIEAQAIAGVGTWEWDLVKGEATWSPETYRMFGVCPDEFEPSYESFLAAVHPGDRERVAAALDEATASGSAYEVEYRLVRPDGEIRTVLARAQVFIDLDGQPVRLVGAAVDITEQRRTREGLEARGALLAMVEELTSVGSFEWEIPSDQVSWSDGMSRIFGFEPGETAGSFEGYLAYVHPEDRERRRRTIEEVLETGRPDDSEYRIVRRDRRVRWLESKLRVIRDDTGSPKRMVGTSQDITDRKLAAEKLEREVVAARADAFRDPLTGLANRTLAMDRVQHAFRLAERPGSDLAVLFIDIDGFKQINDEFGHAVGDQALISIAERLKEHVRRSDTVARIGGDEFFVICEQAPQAPEALDTAERLLHAFAYPLRLDEAQVTVSISIGLSSIGRRDHHTLDAAQLVAEADKAMYETKRRSPGGYAVYSPP